MNVLPGGNDDLYALEPLRPLEIERGERLLYPIFMLWSRYAL